MKNISRYLLSVLVMTLAIQFVGCGAADISSAKLYRQRRDYTKANELLQKALQEDPTSDEAWYLYTENLYDLKQFEKISTIIDTAMLYSTTHRSELSTLKHNTWIELYNGGLTTFTANPDSKEAQQAALSYLEAAQKLAPEQPETYDLLGQVYAAAGDTTKFIETFNRELDLMNASHTQGIAMGLMLHETPESVVRSIGGAPARQQTVYVGGESDSVLVYSYPSKQAYIYFDHEKGHKDWQLTGWRIGATEAEGMQPMSISTQAYEQVANHYYQLGLADLARGDKNAASTEFDKAVPLLMTLQQLDPTDEFATQAIPDIYSRLDRLDKAKQAYQQLLSTHPSKVTYVSYGTLLMKSQDFAGAAAAYQKALDLDPGYQPALYDLAAVYKNWAAADQKTKSPSYKEELQKSTDYFERLRSIDKTDPAVLENLAENYDILGEKDKSLALLSDLEALKSTDAANSADYWLFLGKLYARANRSAESEAAYKKADELRNKH